jgi:hypothetical protein
MHPVYPFRPSGSATAKGIVFPNVIFCYDALVAGRYVVGFGTSFTWSYNLGSSEAAFSGCTIALVILTCVDGFTACDGMLRRSYCA